jgi:hypothetical protein
MKKRSLQVIVLISLLAGPLSAHQNPLNIARDTYSKTLRENKVVAIYLWHVTDSSKPPANCDIWDTTRLSYANGHVELLKFSRKFMDPADPFETPICEIDTFFKPDSLLVIFDDEGYVRYERSKGLDGLHITYRHYDADHRLISYSNHTDKGKKDSTLYAYLANGRLASQRYFIRSDEGIEEFVPDGEKPKKRKSKTKQLEWLELPAAYCYDDSGRYVGHDAEKPSMKILSGSPTHYAYQIDIHPSTVYIDSMIFDEFGNYVGENTVTRSNDDTTSSYYAYGEMRHHERRHRAPSLNFYETSVRDSLDREIKRIESRRGVILKIQEMTYHPNGLRDELRIYKLKKEEGMTLFRRFKYLYDFHK